MNSSTEKDVQVNRYAAVFEGRFSIDWIIELTGYKASEVLKALIIGVKEGLFIRHDLDHFQFASPQKRQGCMKALSEVTVAALHKKITSIILKEIVEDTDQLRDLTIHFLSTENQIDGCRWLLWSGAKLIANCGRIPAYHCYRKAVVDSRRFRDKEADEFFIEATIKFSQFIKDDNEALLEDADLLQDALTRAEKWQYQHFIGALHILIAINLWFINRHEAAKVAFNTGDKVIETIQHPEYKREINATRTFFLYLKGEFKEVIRLFEKYTPDFEYFPHPAGYLSRLVVGLSYTFIGQPSQGLGIANTVHEYCRQSNNLKTAMLAEIYMGHILLEIGRTGASLGHYQSVLNNLELQQGDSQRAWKSLKLAAALAHQREGNNKVVARMMKDFENYTSVRPITALGTVFLIKLLWEKYEQNQTDHNLYQVQAVVERACGSANIFVHGVSCRYRALILKAREEPRKAIIAALNESIQLLDRSGYTIEMIRARIQLRQEFINAGRLDAADRRLEEIQFLMGKTNREFLPTDLTPLLDLVPDNYYHLEKLYLFSEESSVLGDEKEIIQRIILTIHQLTGAERGAMFMMSGEDSDRALTLVTAKNLSEEEVNSTSFSASRKLIQQSFTSGNILTRNAENHIPEWELTKMPILSGVAIPMKFKNHVNGVLYFDNRLIPNRFDRFDMRLFVHFAVQAAMITENMAAHRRIENLQSELTREREYLTPIHSIAEESYDGIIGKSSSMLKVFNQIEQVATTDSTVLITGETGVGKELVARAIHSRSKRYDGPFIRVNCSALPVNLISSELFGHEKGAFTGANAQHKGRFELADGGTIFLDEIGEIPPDVQIALLRILQTKEFQRIGGTETLHSDFRLLAATNRNLNQEAQSGAFREDLFYRLNVFPIVVPPLRERKGDIPLLVTHFMNHFAAKAGKRFCQIRQSEIDRLTDYDWPGNIRELENAIERGIILSPDSDIHIPPLSPAYQLPSEARKGVTFQEMEKNHLIWALKKTKGKVYGKGGAAELLDLHPNTLNSKMKRLGIHKNQVQSDPDSRANSKN